MYKSWELLRNKLKELSRNRGFKANLARKMNIPASLIQRYVDGERTPGIDQLDKFAEALEMHPWELIKPEGAEATPRLPSEEELLGRFVTAWFRISPENKKLALDAVSAIADSFELSQQHKDAK